MVLAAHVDSIVTDTRLIEERRGQVLRAAIKLFSENGYYTTTILQIARQAGVSVGLIYQYFGDKDDILFLALKLVLETYEIEIPLRLEGVEHPVDRLCMAIWAYCQIVDIHRDATLLSYRSSKSLRADRRVLIKEDEARTNSIIADCIHACITGGYMREVNEYLLVYQYVMFSHAWALKYWALRDRFSLVQYVSDGIGLLVEPFLTAKGRKAFASFRQRIGDFSTLQTPSAPVKAKPPVKAKRKLSTSRKRM